MACNDIVCLYFVQGAHNKSRKIKTKTTAIEFDSLIMVSLLGGEGRQLRCSHLDILALSKFVCFCFELLEKLFKSSADKVLCKI